MDDYTNGSISRPFIHPVDFFDKTNRSFIGLNFPSVLDHVEGETSECYGRAMTKDGNFFSTGSEDWSEDDSNMALSANSGNVLV